MKNILTLVDFYSFFYRASLAKFTNELTYNNENSGILFSLIRSYTYIIKNYKNVIFCIDKNTSSSFKKRQYSEYKENRKIKYNEYISKNIYYYKDIFFEILPFYYSYNTSYEADDVISSLVYKFKNNYKIIILTLDNDLWQLTNFNNIIINDLRHKYKKINYDTFKSKFNNLISPKLIPIYKSIFGDKSDNITSSIKKGTRKDKIIQYINEIYSNKFKNIIVNENTYEEIIKILYEKFNDYFIVNLNEIKIKLNIIKLKTKIECNIKFKDGDKNKFSDICKKYNFKKVLKYEDIKNLFNRNNTIIKNILSNNNINNLL